MQATGKGKVTSGREKGKVKAAVIDKDSDIEVFVMKPTYAAINLCRC